MSLKTTIRSAALSAFAALGDLIDIVDYSSVAVATYDPSDGESTQTDTDYEDLQLVREKYEAHEMTSAIMGTDFKGYMLYTELSDITPKKGDYITSGSNIWEVIGWENIYDILWKFQLRPRNN